MGERENLGNFYVDSSGVVRGLQPGDRALARSDQLVKSFGNTTQAVTAKLFSFRSGLLKLAGAFGFGGLLFQAVNSVAAFTKEIASSWEWVKKTTTALTDWANAVLKGEDAIGKLGRTLKGVAAIDQLTAMRELIEKRGAAAANVAQGPTGQVGGFGGAFGATGAMVGVLLGRGGKEDTSRPAAFAAARAGVTQLDQDITNLARSMVAAGQDLSTLEAAFGMAFEGLAPFENPQAVEAAKKAIEDQNQKRKEAIKLAEEEAEMVAGLNAIIHQNAIERNLYNSAVTEALDPMSQALVTMERMDEVFIGMASDVATLNEATRLAFGGIAEETVKLKDIIIDSGAAMGVIEVGIQGIAASLAEAAIGSQKSGKEMLKALFEDLSRACFAYAAMFAAAGVASSTGFGAVALAGSPAQFFKAAGLFAAAGVVAGGLARSVGGGDGGGSRHGGGGGGGAAIAPAASTNAGPKVQIVIHGSVLGVGTSKDEFAREMARLIETAKGDGGR